MPSLLVTPAIAARHGARIRELLAGRLDLVMLPVGGALQPDELAQVHASFLSTDLMKASNKQALNPDLAAFTAAMDAAPALRWLHSCAAGTDRPLLQRLMRRGVTVTSSTGANAQSVAVTAIAGLLALERDVPGWVRAQQARTWIAPGSGAIVPRDLEGGHAVIVGAGAIGRAIAVTARALGMRITAVRQRPLPEPPFDAVALTSDLPQVVADARWLVLACPLTPATAGMLGADLIARLPQGALVANVGRGELVREADLFDAVRSGHLGGVYSDVFVNEPLPPDSPWWTLPRTLVSPHIGGLSSGFARRTEAMFLDNLERWLEGSELRNVAQPV